MSSNIALGHKIYICYQHFFILVFSIFIGVIILSCTLSNDEKNSSHQTTALQFTSSTGHVLSFDQGSVLIASMNHMLKLELVGSKIAPIVEDTDEMNEEKKTTLRQFKKVTYPNTWPGITVMYEAKAGNIIKSTYIIQANQPNQSVNKIRIRYNRPLRLDGSGRLVISYDQGEMVESAPIAWQDINGKRNSVEVAFRLFSEKEIGFRVGAYDPAYPLVIDPSLSWNTFLGGSGEDTCYGSVIDGTGNIVVVGYSNVSWGTPIRAYNSGNDTFVAKLDSSGTLLWNSFLGGGGTDIGHSIAVDGSSNIYVVGYSSTTWGAPIRAYSSGIDVFTAKLDSSGILLWNTFLGGAGNEYGYAITIDGSDNVYVGGSGTATWGTPIRAYSSGDDAYAAKLDSSGILLWNSFLGGGGADYGSAVIVDGNGDVYMGGSSDVTWGTPMRVYSSGPDAFVAKLTGSGTILWNTFLGGGGIDVSYAFAVDGSGNVLVCGNSNATWGTPIRAYNSGSDAYIAKLAGSGTLLWNTFLGGGSDDDAIGMDVDGSGNVYVGGFSGATWGTPIRTYSSGWDGYAAKLTGSGSLLWNSFLGGGGADISSSISVNGSGNVFVGGSSDATWGTPMRAYNSGDDVYVVKIDDAFTATPTYTSTPTFSPTPIETSAGTATNTPTRTLTITPTATYTPILTNTPTLTSTPSQTATVLEPLLSDLIIYPNPFRAPNQQVTIQYMLSEDADVTVTIYTYLGAKVKTVIIKSGEEGGRGHPSGQTNQLTWDGRNGQSLLQATGGYICQVVAKTADGKIQEKATVKIGLIR